MPVLTGPVHAHILTKRSRAGFAVIRLELINIVFKVAPWPCRWGGIAASTLFKQADVGKIPATVKH